MQKRRKLTVQAVALAIAVLLGAQALAADTGTLPEEKRGVVVGTIVGASVGGPIGAGVGAIVGGGWIGKTFGVFRQNRELTSTLAKANQELKARDADESELRLEVAHLTEVLAKTRSAVAVAKAAPQIPIQFRTAESTIAGHYKQQLDEVAHALTARPDTRVTLSGFADRRGADDFNMKLSEQRVAAVKQFLLGHGVAVSQIQTTAYGETRPVAEAQTVENDFFDRRVVMEFSIGDDTPFVAR